MTTQLKATRLQPLVLLQKKAMRLITTSAYNAHTMSTLL